MKLLFRFDFHGRGIPVLILLANLLVIPVDLNAQDFQDVQDFPYETGWLRSLSNPVATNGFWDNWYVDMGVDMNLLFPYQHNYKDVFPMVNRLVSMPLPVNGSRRTLAVGSNSPGTMES